MSRRFLIVFITFMIAPIVLYGQDAIWEPENSTNADGIYHQGNVAVGTSYITSAFPLYLASQASESLWMSNSISSDGVGFYLNAPYAGYYGTIVQQGDTLLMTRGQSQIATPGFAINSWHTGGLGGLRISPDGHIGINTAFPGAFMLAVEGSVMSTGTFQVGAAGSLATIQARPDSTGLWIRQPGTTATGEYFYLDFGDALKIRQDDGQFQDTVTITKNLVKVWGMVESTDGFMFDDGTIQTTKAAGDGHSLDGADGILQILQDVVYVTNNGNVGIGTTSFDETNKLYVNGQASVTSIEIRGADLAERFDISGEIEVVPGVVASIDPERPGSLRVSSVPYDRTVVGVVSGANGVRTGITLGQPGTIADGEYAVAMTGRVYVFADANTEPIMPGDLLTTSARPGHVMSVTDHGSANGAILGKAMSSLDEGTGMVLMVVALQ